MSVPNETDIETLQQIFPNWESTALQSIYIQNKNSLDLTIQSILSLEESKNNNNERLVSTPEPSEVLRGKKVVLPDDFLRPLDWKLYQQQRMDEDFARTLQVEENFRSQYNATTRTSQSTAAAAPAPMDDLGIMKTFSFLKDTAKRNLDIVVNSISTLAENARNTATTTSTTSQKSEIEMKNQPIHTKKEDDNTKEIQSDEDIDQDGINTIASPLHSKPDIKNTTTTTSNTSQQSKKNIFDEDDEVEVITFDTYNSLPTHTTTTSNTK